MTTKQGFKIVRRDIDNRFASAFVLFNTVYYTPNKPTVPVAGHGPLCVFDTEENARRSMALYGFPRMEIWHCDYVPSDKTAVWTYPRQDVYPFSDLPKGTRLADSVTLRHCIS